MNWDCPTERYRLAEQVGPAEYNRLHKLKEAEAVLETVNGYPLRTRNTRFGVLYAVGGTLAAFTTVGAARAHANGLTPAPPSRPDEFV